jgi:hypothetical protein
MKLGPLHNRMIVSALFAMSLLLLTVAHAKPLAPFTVQLKLAHVADSEFNFDVNLQLLNSADFPAESLQLVVKHAASLQCNTPSKFAAQQYQLNCTQLAGETDPPWVTVTAVIELAGKSWQSSDTFGAQYRGRAKLGQQPVTPITRWRGDKQIVEFEL